MFSRIVPFFILGIFLVLFMVGIVLVVHLLILGALVGMILMALSWVKEKLFPSRHLTTHHKKETPRTGRTIDHDDIP